MSSSHKKIISSASFFRLLTAAGLLVAVVIYAVNGGEGQEASPLGLLVLGTAGWLLSLRHLLTGHVLLLIAGAALLVHPFLFHTAFAYSLPGVLILANSLIKLAAWWNKEEGGTSLPH